MSRKYTLKEKKLIRSYKRNHFHQCAYCGKIIKDKSELTVDHIRPLVKQGATIQSNLVICCYSCNQQKGERTYKEYKEHLKEKKQEIYIDKNIEVRNIRLKTDYTMKMKRKSTVATLKSLGRKKRKISSLVGNEPFKDQMKIAKHDSRVLNLCVMKQKINGLPYDRMRSLFAQIK